MGEFAPERQVKKKKITIDVFTVTTLVSKITMYADDIAIYVPRVHKNGWLE